MKANIGKANPSRGDYSALIDGYIEEVNYMPKSFVWKKFISFILFK